MLPAGWRIPKEEKGDPAERTRTHSVCGEMITTDSHLSKEVKYEGKAKPLIHFL